MMSKLKPDEITGGLEKHKEQYRKYFKELKSQEIDCDLGKRIHADRKTTVYRIVLEYRKRFDADPNDGHFNAEEIAHMGRVLVAVCRWRA